uniref:LNR domain-containing protein n=1 Tax=Ascaris lumbricoides TaxID=6252 RepID=A0A9J2P4T5_ASCLU
MGKEHVSCEHCCRIRRGWCSNYNQQSDGGCGDCDGQSDYECEHDDRWM